MQRRNNLQVILLLDHEGSFLAEPEHHTKKEKMRKNKESEEKERGKVQKSDDYTFSFFISAFWSF